MIRTLNFQLLLLLLAAAVYLYWPVWSIGHSLSNNDFKHIYLGTKALLDGSTPYPIQSLHHQAALQGYRQISLNPYVYLPFTGYSMSILAPFSLTQAVWIWFVLNHLFAIGCVTIMCQWFPKWRVGSAAILLMTFAINVPFYRTLSAGQLNLPLLLMIIGGLSLLQKNRPGTAGSLLAIATLYKLMPGIYAIYFLITKQYRSLIAFSLTGLILAFITSAIAGMNIIHEFLEVLSQMGYGKSTWPWAFSFWNDPANQSINSFLSHIFTISNHTKPWINLGQNTANVMTILLTIGLFALWILTLLRCRTKAKSQPHHDGNFAETMQATYCSTLILGLLTPSLMWDHYLVMLILPACWMIKNGIQNRYYFSIGVVAISFALTALPWNFDSASWQTGFAIIFMSMKLWPTLTLFGLSLCFIQWNCNLEHKAKMDQCHQIPGSTDTENVLING